MTTYQYLGTSTSTVNAVKGIATATRAGIYGNASGSGGGGGVYADSDTGYAVEAFNGSTTHATIYANNQAGGCAIEGLTSSATKAGANAGIWGNNSSTGVGVYGNANGSGYGVYGEDRFGVTGGSADTTTVGAYGVGGAISSANGYAVLGINGAAGDGGHFVSTGGNGVYAFTTSGNAVYATASSDTGIGITVSTSGASSWGIKSITTGSTSVGVMGQSNQDSGGFGVTAYVGKTTPSGCTAVYAAVLGSGGTGNAAGDFVGAVSKSSGSFKIDHPLDPANRWLYHSFVESPDMMNVYNGIAVTDANGEVTVQMPAYFDALNKDLRYQLTAIGSPAPNLHVREELRDGRFRIGGAAPSQKVSWQVTGVRQDAFANANRIEVEVDKRPDEVGFYRHPEVHGKPPEMGHAWRLIYGRGAGAQGLTAEHEGGCVANAAE